MVFAVNAVEDGPNNFTAFQALVKQLNGTESTSTNPPNNNAAHGVGVRMFTSMTVALVIGLLS